MTDKLPRLLFSLPFIILGAMHFVNAPAMFWVYLTGGCLVAAGISLNIGKKDALAMRLLAVLLITFALTVFLPMLLKGNNMALSSLLKDLGLAGAALFFAEHAVDKS